jgi:capsular exopolysaccharide synthesis family protein
MELRHYWNILWRARWLLIALPLLVGVLTLALGLLLPTTYTITAQVLMTQQPIGETVAPLTLPNQENYYSWLTSEYANDDVSLLVETRRFTTDVANWVQGQYGITLDPDELTDLITAERQHRMVSITTMHSNQAVARYLAQGAVAMLQQNGLRYWNRQDSAVLSVSEVDMPLEAEPEQGLIGLLLDVVLRSLLALILAVGLAFLWHYLDRTLRTRAQVEALGIAAAGVIPREARASGAQRDTGRDLVTVRAPQSPAAEGYRALRTRLLHGQGNPLCTVLVTSATTAEDRASAAANLAVSLAQTGQRVVLVDADLRRPALHEIFTVANNTGVSTALDGEQGHAPVQPTSINGLSLLAAGPATDRSADVLASSHMDALIASLKRDADIVVFNTPPVGVLTDAAVLATKVDGVLLVMQAGKTNGDRAKESLRLLEQVNAHVVGAVLTDAPAPNQAY